MERLIGIGWGSHGGSGRRGVVGLRGLWVWTGAMRGVLDRNNDRYRRGIGGGRGGAIEGVGYAVGDWWLCHCEVSFDNGGLGLFCRLAGYIPV